MENKDPDNQKGFGLPMDYFARSAAGILQKIEWQEEHRPYPLLQNLKQQPFAVPPAYFETSAVRLELLEYPELSKVKTQVFTLPENYFENNSSRLSQNLKTGSGEKRELPFSVPSGYFERSAKDILSKNPSSSAKLIPLRRRPLALSLAALFIIVIGVWLYQALVPEVQPEDCGTIACLDRKDLLESKSLELMDETELYDVVNVKELERSLNKSEQTPAIRTDSASDISDEELMDNI